jgi:hypothetical protein
MLDERRMLEERRLLEEYWSCRWLMKCKNLKIIVVRALKNLR